MEHFSKNLCLLLLSILFLPFDSVAVLVLYVFDKIRHLNNGNQSNNFSPVEADQRKTVLVTGVNMAKGLSIARLFHRRGHRVIGADTHALSIGRVSRAVDIYHKLPSPLDSSKHEDSNDLYLNSLLDIVQQEKVDLWVSVSDVTAAVADAMAKEVIEARTEAKVIQFGVKDIQLLHDKDTFIRYVRNLGPKVPETAVVENKEQAAKFLEHHGGLYLVPNARRYLLKPIGVDDLARFSMPLLPLYTDASTLACLESIPFSKPGSRYILQEFIDGREFCTHALVIRGRVRAFVACPSADVLMHYEALPADSEASKAMLKFTEEIARARGETFTGHMSFDFLVRKGEAAVYPIECNPRVHTATVLFNNMPELVDEYLSVLGPQIPERPLVTPSHEKRYYWIGQDLVEQVLHPLVCFLFARTLSLSELQESTKSFVNHVRYWKDGTFEVWDPLPWWWLYHVYWPVQFAGYLVQGSWRKLNVSTGKAFKATWGS